MDKALKSSIGIIFLLTTATKCIAFFRDILIVNKVGVSGQTDAFYGAMSIVDSLIVLSGLQAMYSVATVTFPEFNSCSREKKSYFTVFFTLLVSYAFIWALVTFIFSTPIVDTIFRGMPEDNRILTAHLLKILTINILLITAFKTINSIFGLEKLFINQNISFFFINLFSVVTVYFSSNENVITNLTTILPLLYFLSLIFQYVVLWIRGYTFNPVDKESFIKYRKKILVLILPLTIVTGFESLAGIADKMIASFLGEGIITSITLARNIAFFSVSAILYSVTKVIFPEFAILYQKRDFRTLKSIFNTSVEFVAFIFIPISIFLVLFSSTIVKIIYLRKSFSPEDFTILSKVLSVYGIALFFNVLYQMPAFLLQSGQKNSFLGYLGAISFFSNILFSIVFSYFWGYVGIPLGTLFCNLLYTVLLFIYSKKLLNIVLTVHVFKNIVTILVTSLLLGLLLARFSYQLPYVFNNLIVQPIFDFLLKLLFFPLCWGVNLLINKYIFNIHTPSIFIKKVKD